MTSLENERIARLEVKVDTLIKQREEDAEQMKELIAILNQAKGARWLLVGLATLGGTLAGLLAQWGFKGS
jgi:predicted esterase YcpF (UPF0227 family)